MVPIDAEGHHGVGVPQTTADHNYVETGLIKANAWEIPADTGILPASRQAI